MVTEVLAEFWQVRLHEAVDLEANQFEPAQIHHLVVLVVYQYAHDHPEHILLFLYLQLSSTYYEV